MMLGPVQLVVLGCGETALPRTLIDQLRRWCENGAVRLVDALIVRKTRKGPNSECSQRKQVNSVSTVTTSIRSLT